MKYYIYKIPTKSYLNWNCVLLGLTFWGIKEFRSSLWLLNSRDWSFGFYILRGRSEAEYILMMLLTSSTFPSTKKTTETLHTTHTLFFIILPMIVVCISLNTLLILLLRYNATADYIIGNSNEYERIG